MPLQQQGKKEAKLQKKKNGTAHIFEVRLAID